MDIFGEGSDSKNVWISFSDIEAERIELWNNACTGAGINREIRELVVRIDDVQRQELISPKKWLIAFVNEEVDSLSTILSNPYLIILTDQNGVAINLTGPTETIKKLESVNVGVGTSFALEHTGINGISLSMQLEDLVAVQGSEHSLHFFSKWSCVCSPIKQGDQICGFLDISVPLEEDVRFIAHILRRIVNDIESRMISAGPTHKQVLVYEHFDLYSLTNREKQIGFGWLQNQSALQISIALGISEATVRHMLKKVYSKTKCHDRGGFIRKFLVSIPYLWYFQEIQF
ncbi:hypothetical protein BC351_38400 [Paenibacillus ferrarius]|uniref:HTH luxR-type domain-containing protein n=1 Tax=Paenibacillus ferrarius TaxID=1469647 RepID=A0A1V4HA17_9BACL|nr:LuxR C-terminal-related transcriptional regulator [Paenibacillus ferrarius]OPH48270.1 hypothetical protein BC351_38400 [Paenibacillus ferrarius]